MIYKIVQKVNDQFVVTNPKDIYAWAEANDRPVRGVEKNPGRRLELQGQPRITGLLGPMWDGYLNDEPVVRYEDRAVYALLGW